MIIFFGKQNLLIKKPTKRIEIEKFSLQDRIEARARLFFGDFYAVTFRENEIKFRIQTKKIISFRGNIAICIVKIAQNPRSPCQL